MDVNCCIYDVSLVKVFKTKADPFAPTPFFHQSMPVGSQTSVRCRRPDLNPMEDGHTRPIFPPLTLMDHEKPRSAGATGMNTPKSADNQPPTAAGNKIKCMNQGIYSVSVSRDLICYERLESILEQIKEPYNRNCPYCLKSNAAIPGITSQQSLSCSYRPSTM